MPSIVTAEGRLSERLVARRFQTQALVAFAAVALAFAGAGLYAALIYQVALRRREIGIRTALGAPTGAIVRLFVRDGVALTLVGAASALAAPSCSGACCRVCLYQTAAIDVRSYLLAVCRRRRRFWRRGGRRGWRRGSIP